VKSARAPCELESRRDRESKAEGVTEYNSKMRKWEESDFATFRARAQ